MKVSELQNLTIDIVDILGRKIKNVAKIRYALAGEYIFSLDSNDLPQGILFIAIYSNNKLISTIKYQKQ